MVGLDLRSAYDWLWVIPVLASVVDSIQESVIQSTTTNTTTTITTTTTRILQVMPVPESVMVESTSLRSASPVVSVEPRVRKFHQPVTISMPLPPRTSSRGPTASSSLRLLCSMTGT